MAQAGSKTVTDDAIVIAEHGAPRLRTTFPSHSWGQMGPCDYVLTNGMRAKAMCLALLHLLKRKLYMVLFFSLPLYTKAQGWAWMQLNHGDAVRGRKPRPPKEGVGQSLASSEPVHLGTVSQIRNKLVFFNPLHLGFFVIAA